jgi:PPM family protein phosphatase
VDQSLGPVSLSRPEFATSIAIDDLPTSYQASLQQGIEVDNRAAADVRVAELRLQAMACRWAQFNGEVCRTVPATWTAPTPSPSPTASPSPSSSASATPTPRPTFSPGATPSFAPTVPPTVPPGAVATGGPVTS